MKAMLVTEDRDIEKIVSAAIVAEYCGVDDIFVVSPNSTEIIDFVLNNYDVVYSISDITTDPKAKIIYGMSEAISEALRHNPYLAGFSFLEKDISNNFFATNLLKIFDNVVNVIHLVRHLLHHYIIDKRTIKDVMLIKSSNLSSLCFKLGAKICIIFDERKQFVIQADRHSDVNFDVELFKEIAKIVPDDKYLITSRKLITYGSLRNYLPSYVLQKCDYNEEIILSIVENWYNRKIKHHK